LPMPLDGFADAVNFGNINASADNHAGTLA
jgi:hypothetical protein